MDDQSREPIRRLRPDHRLRHNITLDEATYRFLRDAAKHNCRTINKEILYRLRRDIETNGQ